MRIRDWSSDVCSSDLRRALSQLRFELGFGRLDRRPSFLIVPAPRDGDGGRERPAVDRDQHVSGDEAGTDRGAALDHRQDPGSAIEAVELGGRGPVRCAIFGEMVKKQPRSEEHTSELQSLMRTSYAVFCLKKKK